MDTINNILKAWLQQIGVAEGNLPLLQRIILIIAIVLIAYLIHMVCRKILMPVVQKLTSKTQFTWDDYLLSETMMHKAFQLIPPIVVYALIPFAFADTPVLLNFILKICWVYITIVAMRLIFAFLSTLYTISSEHEKLKNHSMKGFYQMLKLVVICVGTIIIVSTFIDKDPIAILTGLGAGTAILMLVFQDTIKGLVAGIQLTANDMVRPGDWITMPKYGADGDVMEVSLTTVKVRNWDKTITTVPPYALVNDSFQNWRGMFDIGGRRVKRSINIDMHSVRFCTKKELENYKKQAWMEGFENTGKEEVNLHIFRHYLDYYLRHHPKVNQDMIILVRQLQPTAQGMPIELYFFSANTMWVKYEALQAEVFDHVLATVHQFDLRVFQSPTGHDLQAIK